MKRSRLKYLTAAVVVVLLGLASRHYSDLIPPVVASYAGDTLWALTAFLGIGILFPGSSTARVGLAAMLFAVSIELSQLYQTPWINQLRNTTLGALILGQGFLWSDILCYAIGVGSGYILELWLYRKHQTEVV